MYVYCNCYCSPAKKNCSTPIFCLASPLRMQYMYLALLCQSSKPLTFFGPIFYSKSNKISIHSTVLIEFSHDPLPIIEANSLEKSTNQ